MRRIVLLSLAGIAVLLVGTLAVILSITDGGPGSFELDALPVAAPPPPAKLAPVIVAPPMSATDPALEAFLHPAPKAVPEPPAPPPPVDLAREQPVLERVVSRKCGSMQVRLGDEMRKGGEQMTGQAILLFDAESVGKQVKLGQSQQQSPGNMRPSLVACAQMALRDQVLDIAAPKKGERFTVQVVLGMKE